MTGQPIEKTGPEEYTLPAFWTEIGEKDVSVLRRQMRGRKFDASAVIAAARRCRHGCPQIIVSSPVSASGVPFPTIFWLTCPFLDHRCGELESEQRISELEAFFAAMPAAAVEKMHQDYAALRLVLIGGGKSSALSEMNEGMRRVLTESGVGGINWREARQAVKCLHLQTATWLGMGAHPAGEWLAEKLGALDCADGRCLKPPADPCP
ncbi:DUF501 domain-containing protein [Cloacibacillus porcorum]|uniref:DUF501 domain-containing protein n=1 Tax=Cloacibacillus porcorum TaxID=1197717 RepID=UPI0023F3B876|nr:DUF501 domain-containing protein [Cloacibacillus porcorum]MDD7650046.1 DUF501 domain-containing protein [Cloacibacillus porcorum]MDY4092663.1 DUF501 domain-containing protein [Cloacibacillus porcorum]